MPSRVLPVAGILLLAPLFAEYSSGYLANTGDPMRLAGDLVFFVPLYGGAALLIREVAVRRNLGWPGILALGAAFGTIQAGITDRSIFTRSGTGIEMWPDIVGPTWVPGLGVSAGAALGWVLGHVITSIAAPIAVVEALAPRTRGKPLLQRTGIVVAGVLLVAISILIHREIAKTYRPIPGLTQYAAVASIAATLVAVALGWPRRRDDRAADTRGMDWRTFAVPLPLGATMMLATDVASSGWFATIACCAVTGVAGVTLARPARCRWWLPASAGTLALGSLLLRAIEAFATPAPAGVSAAAKLSHHIAFLVLTLGLLAAVIAVTLANRRRGPVPVHTPR